MKKIFSAVGSYIHEIDKLAAILCLAAAILSVLLQLGLYKAGKVASGTVKTQVLACVLGIIAAIILSKIDYGIIGKLWKLHTGLAYFLVGLTFIPGIGQGRGEVDDVAWLMVPGTSFTIQPSEFLKISFIVVFAYHLSLVRDNIDDIKVLFWVLLHAAVPILLIHFQGDDGTALIFAVIVAAMLFAAGIGWKYIAMAVAAAGVALPVLWFVIMDEEKRQRVLSVYSGNVDIQGTGWQQYYGKLSIGSGQLWGNGIFSGQGQFQTVPEIHNDFIFAFIGEAMGFIGSVGILVLLAVLCINMLSTAQRSTDTVGQYICVGVFAMLAVQIVINIGMNLVLFPVVGVTLPLFSSGGSSILSTFMGIGLVLSVYMRSNHQLFKN
ncbi:MAG: FtsW/RodA/SpoVE family cell cycle protein [Oscillospiraceae bacterium]